MARITGMLLGLGLLIVLSNLASPASAWDHDDDDGYKKLKKHRHLPPPAVWDVDDDDGHKKFRRGHIPPGHLRGPGRGHGHGHGHGRQPIFLPPDRGYGHPGSRGILAPQPEPYRSGPVIPPPVHPSAFEHEHRAYQSSAIASPPVSTVPHVRPGQFIDGAGPLYHAVRVKDAKEAPPFGLHRTIAVASPDPVRFPGVVFVQVAVPPGPPRKVEVDDRGAKIKLDYDKYEIEIESKKGVVEIEYDD